MALLIITTILWAFSFSLIGEYLAGSVDSYFSVLMRVGLAALVFLPFLRTRGQSPRTIVLYMLVGAMQLGIMYLLAFRAYLYLTVSEFLLFTVFTPLYITLIYDLLSGRKLRWGYLLSAALAVLGAAIIRYDKVSDHFWTGLLLVQLSNLCFAIDGGLQAPDGGASDAAAQCLCLVLCRGLYRGGGGVVYARQRPEAADHHAAVERAGVARRGGFRAGLLYVELWRHPGGCRHAGDHE